jgi:hypothetical protein
MPRQYLSSAISLSGFFQFILAEYPVACYVGSKLLQNLYPKGQNSVILRPLAAEIGILKILPVYFAFYFSTPCMMLTWGKIFP